MKLMKTIGFSSDRNRERSVEEKVTLASRTFIDYKLTVELERL